MGCRVVVLLNRQRVSHPTSCQASTSSLLLFVFECSRAPPPCTPPPSLLLTPTATPHPSPPFSQILQPPPQAENRVLQQLIAAAVKKKKKKVLDQGVRCHCVSETRMGAKYSAKHGVAGFDGGPAQADAVGLP